MSKRRNFSVEFKRGVDAQRVDPFGLLQETLQGRYALPNAAPRNRGKRPKAIIPFWWFGLFWVSCNRNACGLR